MTATDGRYGGRTGMMKEQSMRILDIIGFRCRYGATQIQSDTIVCEALRHKLSLRS